MKTRGASVYVAAFAAVIGSVMLWFDFDHGRSLAPLTRPAHMPPASSDGEPFVPLPQSLALNAGKVALGKQLFNEVRLSKDATVSCAHCHRIDRGGVDRLRTYP